MNLIKVLLVIIMFEFTCAGSSQERDLKTMLEQEKMSKNDTIHVHLLINICDSLYKSKPEEAIKYGTKAVEISKRINFSKGEAYAYKYIGIGFFMQGEYVKAMDYFHRSLEIFEATNYKNGIANILNNIGVIYNNQGDNAKALEIYLKSLKIAEEINDSLRIETALINIALIYSKDLSTFDKSKESYLKALEISEKMGYRTGSRIIYINLGSLLFDKGNYSEALSYYKKSLESLQDTNSYYGVTALICIGEIFTKWNDYSNAEINLKAALKIARNNNFRLEMGKAMLFLGKAYLQKDETQKALDFFKQSEVITREVGANSERMESYNGISKSFAKRSDFKNAYNYLLMESNLRDTLFSDMNQLQINQLKIQYEIELMLKENENLKSEAILRNAKNRLQTTMIVFLTLGFLLISIFMILLARANSNKMKANKRLNITLDIVNSQKQQIENAHTEITASIKYAKSIQSAVLPKMEQIESLLGEHFILFKPAEIVSGDFYWVSEIGNKTVIVAADCTGHGVPGAFMSMLGMTLLDEIINKEYVTNPGLILGRLRKEVITTLKQKGDWKDQKEGMDIAICTIDRQIMKMQFAGAINSLYLIRNSAGENAFDIKGESNIIESIIEFRGDAMPIGISDSMDNFTSHEIDIKKGDTFYLFTDGFPDQFGGVNHKKFSYKQFKEQLVKTNSKTLYDQKLLLEKVLSEWMGNNNQTDDILVIGFRIN
jgi:serine phosphatase RsbU (regulator of sigma subunit)/Tfp pilus assembly protein PilF